MTGATRKFIDFLMIEQMNHAGQENGSLKATRIQLADYGIGTSNISGAIEQAERLMLVKVKRPGMRMANLYTLTWLPTPDGAPPSNDWKRYKKQKSAPQPEVSLTSKRRAVFEYGERRTANSSDLQTEVPSISLAPHRRGNEVEGGPNHPDL